MARLQVPLWFALSTAAIYVAVVAVVVVAAASGLPSWATGIAAGTGIGLILYLSSEMRHREIRKEVPA